MASFLNMLGLAGEMVNPSQGNQSDAYQQTGNLLKEAAGKQPRSADVNWWDAPSRDFFHDILEMNQRYAAEAKNAVQESRMSNMNQMGVSLSDLTPSQLGKPR
jgi:hypothetical protein